VIRRLALLVAVLVTVGALALSARSGDDGPGGDDDSPATAAAGDDRNGEQVQGGGNQAGDPEPVLPRSSCPPDLSNCVVASGRVIYVEAVDPDGDGDAHFITDSEEGITIPGMTVFDVGPDLRPDPLPEVGDLIGGAGPVFRGSYGQKQIEVIEFHVAR
jgi:hypothetical protein